MVISVDLQRIKTSASARARARLHLQLIARRNFSRVAVSCDFHTITKRIADSYVNALAYFSTQFSELTIRG